MNNFYYLARVLGAQVVPDSFSARYSVVRKKYLYRFAIVKSNALPHIPYRKNLFPIPIIEKSRCHFVFNPEFNLSLAQEATNLFVGSKDFRAFAGKSMNPDVITQRNIEELTLSETTTLLPSLESNHYNFWQLTCTGKSFLFRQVRRIVGVLIAVGQQKISLPEVEAMFVNPTRHSWNDKVAVAPPEGLYLHHIEYKEEDLLCDVDSKKEIDIIRI